MWDEAQWSEWEKEHRKMVAEFGDAKIEERARWYEKTNWGKMVSTCNTFASHLPRVHIHTRTHTILSCSSEKMH